MKYIQTHVIVQNMDGKGFFVKKGDENGKNHSI